MKDEHAQLFADRIQYVIDELHLLKQQMQGMVSSQQALTDRIYKLESNPKVVYRNACTEQPWEFPYK